MTDATFGFDSAFLHRLERLSLLNRRPLQGPSAGPRRSPRHGASVEFADFRTYVTGDDFRRVDWNAYARLDRLFLMTDSDWRSGLRSLRAVGQEVTAIQILAPEEIDPPLRGDWKLVDAETSAGAEVTISPRLLHRYREALERHTKAITEFCRREGIAFAQLRTDVDLNGTVLSDLRAAGILA